MQVKYVNTTKQFIRICEILESARTIYKIWSMFSFSTVWFFSFAKKKNHLNRINWKNVMENSVWSEKTNKMKEKLKFYSIVPEYYMKINIFSSNSPKKKKFSWIMMITII